MKKISLINKIKNDLMRKFPSIKFLNEYTKNGTLVLEIFSSAIFKELIDEYCGELCTNYLIEYGKDILILIYSDKKVLNWYHSNVEKASV